MKKLEKQYSPNQPKANLQRGAFSYVTQKYNQYSKKQIDQLLQDLQKTHDQSYLEQRSYEIPLNIQKIKKFEDSIEEQYPNKSLNINEQISFKSCQEHSNNSPSKIKGFSNNQFQNDNFHSRLINNKSGISIQINQEEQNQQLNMQNQNINSFYQMWELKQQFEDMCQNSQDKTLIINDLVEQIKSEYSNLKNLQQDYSNFKIKNDIEVIGIEKQIEVQRKKLKILNLRIQQKEDFDIEEIELRQKINEEFQHLNEQIQFLETENQLEVEQFQAEILLEKQIQAQMIKQLAQINNQIEEKQKKNNQEEQLLLLETKQQELKELEDRKVKVITDIQEVQNSYNKLDQQYQLAIELTQNESQIEQTEFKVTIQEQNLLIQQLMRDIKILSELITNQSNDLADSHFASNQLSQQLYNNETLIDEDQSLKSTNHSSPKMKDNEVKEQIYSFQQFSQISQNKIYQAIQQQMHVIDEEIQKSQIVYEDQLKKKESLIQEIEKIKASSTQRQTNFKSEIQQLQATLEKDKTEMQNNQSQVIQKENELKEIDSLIDGNTDIINQYQVNIKNTNIQIEQLQLNITDLKDQIKELEEQFSKKSKKGKKNEKFTSKNSFEIQFNKD
ncbi:hypothetical protein TTHERM_00149440 (macronuclear) [Tetrahymena thermophila SB210]|uniref:Uncharacterized protein n=1 Tax=Tetrahymena thermophila (strain SB210) TaxID=312017 RepID=I7LWB8_TETTS|nr:hypothetical protein TTHERM_00149440 [Tetrahymena thermophila SB210]EAS01334.2 hypothetical protein TTHERM_00149440 [Tetrahymena thermophila SB210]|eukprot:XP_001021579.2 hypothetical protein TTHERM_00149440 [Tetrahymena thermophila SB210]